MWRMLREPRIHLTRRLLDTKELPGGTFRQRVFLLGRASAAKLKDDSCWQYCNLREKPVDWQRMLARDDIGLGKDLFSRERRCERAYAATHGEPRERDATLRAVFRFSNSTPSHKTPSMSWQNNKMEELNIEYQMGSSNPATRSIAAVADGERPSSILR